MTFAGNYSFHPFHLIIYPPILNFLFIFLIPSGPIMNALEQFNSICSTSTKRLAEGIYFVQMNFSSWCRIFFDQFMIPLFIVLVLYAFFGHQPGVFFTMCVNIWLQTIHTSPYCPIKTRFSNSGGSIQKFLKVDKSIQKNIHAYLKSPWLEYMEDIDQTYMVRSPKKAL